MQDYFNTSIYFSSTYDAVSDKIYIYMPDNDDIDASGILTLTTQVEFISMDTIPTVFLGVFSISKQFIYGRGNGQLILINEKDNPDFTQKMSR